MGSGLCARGGVAGPGWSPWVQREEGGEPRTPSEPPAERILGAERRRGEPEWAQELRAG